MNPSFLHCLLLSDIPWYGCPALFNQSPAEGHLGCFQAGAVMNKVAPNIHVQVLCENPFSFFLRLISKHVMAGSYDNCIFSCIDIGKLISRVALAFPIPVGSLWLVHFSASSLAFGGITLFYFSRSDRCVVIAHCGFKLHLPNNSWSCTSFHVFIGHLLSPPHWNVSSCLLSMF